MISSPWRTTHRIPSRGVRGFNRRRFLIAALAGVFVVGCMTKSEPEPNLPDLDPPLAEDLVQALAGAYLTLDHTKLASLLAPGFTFHRNAPDPQTGELFWDRDTELRIHQRMFDPEEIPSSDTPLADEFWLQSVNITLTPEATFTERLDLYTTADPPGPIDPTLGLVEEAPYGINIFLQLQGEDDYLIQGRAYVVLLTDLSKAVTDPGKFLLYRIEDFGSTQVVGNTTQGVIEGTWTSVKEIYR